MARERERLQASREPETSLLVPVWVTGVGVSVQEQGTPYAEAAMPFGPASCLSTLAGGPGTTPWSGGAAGGPGREAGRRRVLSSALS